MLGPLNDSAAAELAEQRITTFLGKNKISNEHPVYDMYLVSSFAEFQN